MTRINSRVIAIFTQLIFVISSYLNAQIDYISDEFIIQFVEGSSTEERQAVRELYGITEFEIIGDGNYELWQNITFPFTVNSEEETTIIHNVIELRNDFDVQEGSTSNSNARAHINDGSPNYKINIIGNTEDSEEHLYFSLPYCQSENYRFMGNVGATRATVNVVVLDQVIDEDIFKPYLPSNKDPRRRIFQTENLIEESISGGNHGKIVGSIILEILYQVNIPFRFHALGIFDQNGETSLFMLFRALSSVRATFPEGAIVNLSASMSYHPDLHFFLQNYRNDLLADANILLVSSAGNDGIYSDYIFPGCLDAENEITVVGTQNCFQDIWQGSNMNSLFFEIGAEANNILVENQEYSSMVSGTSFATALVTAAAAQVASKYAHFSPGQIKDILLSAADTNPNLIDAVQNGRILNVSAAIDNVLEERPTNISDHSTSISNSTSSWDDVSTQRLQISCTPNPFFGEPEIQLTISDSFGSAQILLCDQFGRIHWTREIQLLHQRENITLTPPPSLPRGTYFLHVSTSTSSSYHQITKQ